MSSDEPTGRLTLFFSGITCCTVVLGAVVGVFQYLETHRANRGAIDNGTVSNQIQADVARLARQQSFLNEHLDICNKLSQDASTIANVNQTQQPGYNHTSVPEIEFRVLQSGKAALYAGNRVIQAVNVFSSCVGDSMYTNPNGGVKIW